MVEIRSSPDPYGGTSGTSVLEGSGSHQGLGSHLRSKPLPPETDANSASCLFPAAIRPLEAQPAGQLLPRRGGLRGDDLARGGAVERRALQLSPDLHLQEGNR